MIDVNTADMFYADILVDGNHKYNLHPLESYGFKTFGETKLKTSDHLSFIPAWSLTALLELIQDDIKIEKTLFDQSDMFTYSIIGDAYQYRSHEHENLIDAAFEMVCWLKTEKYI